ncbi:hypothetical protein B7P43_G11208 [Cryptotermes secundus]|uniref:Mos1 transposase HTH domain-containing protein n=1 Tax=Cryptotermes secundus TaxID=105785 RepID=A0A2J7QMD6_9NEOP|nr:hypothetical protein B7P43_G11208 [Cryptotermes secundus]
MADFREQRAAVKFCFLLGKSGTETLEMLKTAYKDDAMGKTQVFEWFSRFKNGEMSIDDKPRKSPEMIKTFFQRFADVAEVKEKKTEALSSISKDEFRQCFEKWNKRLDKCISVSGEYFEGD